MTKTRRNILIAASTLAVVTATTTAFLAAPTTAGAFFGRHGGHFGHRGGHGDEHDPERMREHMRHMTERMLSEVDASDDQIDQVVAILSNAFEELHGMREIHGTQREAFTAALGAAEVDRDALEALRAEGVAMAEQASERIVSALADAAEVLTPEQREELMRHHASLHDRFASRDR